MKKDFSDEIKSRAIELGFEKVGITKAETISKDCLLYTSPSPRDS